MDSKFVGIINEIEKIEEKNGETNGNKWNLFSCKINISKNIFGMSSFDVKDLLKEIEGLAIRDEIEFNYVEKGAYKNIVLGSIKVVRHGVPKVEGEEKIVVKSDIKVPSEEEVLDKVQDVYSKLEANTQSKEDLLARALVWASINGERNILLAQSFKEKNMAGFSR